MMHNSNLMFAIYPIKIDKQDAMETFFVNSLWKDHKVNQGNHDMYYTVDGSMKFKICDATTLSKNKISSDTIYARYNTEVGKGNQIPLWLLGFLYWDINNMKIKQIHWDIKNNYTIIYSFKYFIY